ncbi:cupin domain-containing protein [Pontibacter anaerobius]|uniref:Cupin domain-containing protein n=1 Tax=Pontibacter anaerobius TaxID=2993940 RepID=A0ABT3RIM6_9BACT|nr:cupin domain-containing protein [Pontibacter anaerobius]MCX2741405.1 cupin domain-containing protein [Pontibacter anaerobius]
MPDTPPSFQEFTELGNQLTYSHTGFQSKVLLEREKLKAILFAFEQGQQLKEHKTTQDVLLLILEGECTFDIHQSQRHLKAGEVYRIPANVPHALQALTDFKMVLLK